MSKLNAGKVHTGTRTEQTAVHTDKVLILFEDIGIHTTMLSAEC